MIFGYFILFVALFISAVAAYYSIAGLMAIFSAAVVPIIVMGASLEVGKIAAAVWLKLNWHRASLTYKLYLVPALVFLMLLTSMGIFGFLSKAHSDQSLVSGDVQAKISVYDEKIKTAKDNIDANRKALKQMDEAVDQVMGRSADEKGADKAVSIRRSQAKERARLLSEITTEQKTIATVNEARAPIAAEVRKVEAEVGPIKYIAAFIYGDNPDANLLEKAVTWVIILIVAVFDPLALVLILAAQQSLKWERQARKDQAAMSIVPPDEVDTRSFTSQEIAALDQVPAYEADDGPLTRDQLDQIKKKTTAEQHPYLFQPFTHFKNTKPVVYRPLTVAAETPIQVIAAEESTQLETAAQPDELPASTGPVEADQFNEIVVDTSATEPELVVPTVASSSEEVSEDDDELAAMDSAEKAAARKWKAANPGHTLKFQRRLVDMGKLAQLPWLATEHNSSLVPDIDLGNETQSGFGIAFPVAANKGDSYLRVDRLPSVLYKFNGSGWIQVDKALSDRYAHNEAYIDHLISKIDTGEYDPDLLSDAERDQIERRLTGN